MKTYHRTYTGKTKFIMRLAYNLEVFLENGKEYLTSEEEDGMVTVFTTAWFQHPVEDFTGAKPFTTQDSKLAGNEKTN